MMIKSFDLLLLICFTQTQMETESSHTPLLSDDTDEVLVLLAGMLWIVKSSLYIFISVAQIRELIGSLVWNLLLLQ